MHKRGFTLIELLVVIAIISILSIVVVLTLNPADLLRQSRDSNRIADMATLNTALGFYSAQGGSLLGNGSTTYLSVPDLTATSSVGDQCQGLGLPALPASDTYFCAASSSFRNTTGGGWIPVNLSSITGGSPLGSLPVDPLNQTSSNFFYTYTTNGTQYQVTAILESQKYKTQFGNIPVDPGYPEVLTQGSNLTLSELYSPTGLVGYWPLNEGTGTVAIDASGNQNTGAWNGSTTNGSYYGGGKVGTYGGVFNGNNDYINTGTSTLPLGNNARTVIAWVNPNYSIIPDTGVFAYGTNAGTQISALNICGNCGGSGSVVYFNAWAVGQNSNFIPIPNIWSFIGYTYSSNTLTIYYNGTSSSYLISSINTTLPSSSPSTIGADIGQAYFSGLIDDVRVYNRALSASEIQALYNAEK